MNEMPQIYEERKVIARKGHKCCDCGDTITRGEPYCSISGMWDGEFSRYKLCTKCKDISDRLSIGQEQGEGPSIDDWQEFYIEMEIENPPGWKTMSRIERRDAVWLSLCAEIIEPKNEDTVIRRKKEIIRHSLGLTIDGKGTPYRNRYLAAPGHHSYDLCIEMVTEGLMASRGAVAEFTGGDTCFVVTPEGVKLCTA